MYVTAGVDSLPSISPSSALTAEATPPWAAVEGPVMMAVSALAEDNLAIS